MNKAYFLLPILVTLFLASCVNTKYIHKRNFLGRKNKVYRIHDDGGGNPQIEEHTVKEGGKATIEDKGSYLIINPTSKNKVSFTVANKPFRSPITGWRAESQEKFYFPENDSVFGSDIAKRLTYFDSKPVLQGLTIPIKVRPKLTSPALKDSFPSTVETGVNVGVAFGWKLSENVFSAKRNVFSQNINRYSLTPGTFLGFGGVDLKKANTRDPVISFERKAFYVTTGGFLMFGFNNLNFGYTIGVDFATGIGSKEWLYQGKIWHGIAFAIDLIK